MKYIIKFGNNKEYYHMESNKQSFITSIVNNAKKYDSKTAAEKKLKALKTEYPERDYSIKAIHDLSNVI